MTSPVVETTGGPLRGSVTAGTARFLGVRYAVARRFRPPQPPAVATRVVDATRFGPAAPQPPSRLQAAIGPLCVPDQDEDCLNLNIWTPAWDAPPRPVLVWLHGGAFLAGAGSQPAYDGARLSRRHDIVVVTINYRLGALGFLPLADDGVNLGLQDQIAALAWVRANIAAFGGDPGRVTLAGQSAGAQSALALLHRAPDPLFHRVILRSAPLGLAPLDLAEAERRARLLLGRLGLAAGEYARLRHVPVAALLDAQVALARAEARPFHLGPVFQLVADGATVPEDLLAPPPSALPVTLTANAHEADAFTAPDPRVQAMTRRDVEAALAPLLGDAVVDRYAEHLRRHPELGPPQIAADLTTDHFFHRDLDPLATRLRARTRRFTWHPAGSPLRACHCIDLPFVFDTVDAWPDSPMLRGARQEELHAQSRVAQQHLRDDLTAAPLRHVAT